MTIRTAIVDDDAALAEKYRDFLSRYGMENDINFETDCYSNGLDFVEAYRSQYNIVFLDIDMPHYTGMEAAEYIRKKDSAVCIIFITNLARYAVQGYSVEASDFIVKPVEYPAFANRLKKAVEQCGLKQSGKYIVVNFDSGMSKVYAKDIIYIEVNGHCLIYHMLSGQHNEWRSTLKNREQELSPYNFVRCNNYTLLNLSHVTSVEGNSVRVVGGAAPIDISRGKRKTFMQKLAEFWGNNL